MILITFAFGQIALAKEWTITLEDANNAPYEKVEQEKKISGLHFEMVEAVAKKIANREYIGHESYFFCKSI